MDIKRTDLQVPYHEKDEAKALGAYWDPKNKTWFVPPGKDVSDFERWIFKYDVQAEYFYIAQSARICWKCHTQTSVYAIIVPPNHQYSVFQNHSSNIEWRVSKDESILSYVKDIHPSTLSILNEVIPNYKQAYSRTVEERYWINHCDHCKSKQGDFHLHEECDAPFLPLHESDGSRINCYKINIPISASCDGQSGRIGWFRYSNMIDNSETETQKSSISNFIKNIFK